MTDLDQLPASPTEPADDSPGGPPRRHRSRWWWVVAVVVVGSAVGAGLGRWEMRRDDNAVSRSAPTTTVAGDPSIPEGLIGGSASKPRVTHTIDNRVFVVGDSVMQGAAPYLGTDLPNWSIIADTKVGRFLNEANTVITKRRSDIANIAVLNLGNNYDGNQAEFSQQVATALSELSGVEHIIWLNVAEFQDDRSQVNDVLQQAAATHPNLTIVDWNSWWAANRSFTGADHLHLTDQGAKAYASLVAAAVTKVTETTGEVPAAGVKDPSLNTSGTLPGSRQSSSSGTRYRPPTTVHHTVTTANTSVTGQPVVSSPPVATSPPATTPVTASPTTKPATTPTSPVATSVPH